VLVLEASLGLYPESCEKICLLERNHAEELLCYRFSEHQKKQSVFIHQYGRIGGRDGLFYPDFPVHTVSA
jgi:hypothetical protein